MLWCAAAAVAAGGCSMPRTFPSLSGKESVPADMPPLPQVVTEAFLYAHKTIAPGTPLVYNLPEETNLGAWRTYEQMLAPARPMCPTDIHAWTLRQARIDGAKAQVDLEYPTRDGFYQQVTVHLQDASGGVGYKPQYLQYWRIPINNPTCHTPPEVLERHCPGYKPSSSGAAGAPAASASQGGGSAARPPVRTEDPNK